MRLCFTVPLKAIYGHMETRPDLRVSSDRLEKPGIKPGTAGYMASGSALHHETSI